MNSRPYVVIGAGWAGLTAALDLVTAGQPVVVLEAAPQAGGRARSLTLDGAVLDNGQHLLVGACQATLASLRRVGIDPDSALEPLPFGLCFWAPQETSLPVQPVMVQSPHPNPLPEAEGVKQISRRPLFALQPRSTHPLALAQALWQATQGLGSQAQRSRWLAGSARLLYQTPTAQDSVQQWLQQAWQPPVLIERLWEPLCLAIMNCPAKQASATLLHNVLRQTLRGGPQAARLLIPKRPLGALFPEPALDHLRQSGAQVRLGWRVTHLQRHAQEHYSVHNRAGDVLEARGIILATSPHAAARLLGAHPELAATQQSLQPIRARSICTVYLRYAQPINHLPPLTGLLGQYGQWLIPRAISGEPHWLAVVISAAETVLPPEHHALESWVAQQLQATFPELGPPLSGRCICERQATLDPYPGLDAQRPLSTTAWPGLRLAGDYCTPGLPSTLEAAVLSGHAAVREL